MERQSFDADENLLVTGVDYARFIFGDPDADDADHEMDFATSPSEDNGEEPEYPGRGPPLTTRPGEDVSHHATASEDSGRSTTPESNTPDLVLFPFSACPTVHVFVFVLRSRGPWLTRRMGNLTLSLS